MADVSTWTICGLIFCLLQTQGHVLRGLGPVATDDSLKPQVRRCDSEELDFKMELLPDEPLQLSRKRYDLTFETTWPHDLTSGVITTMLYHEDRMILEYSADACRTFGLKRYKTVGIACPLKQDETYYYKGPFVLHWDNFTAEPGHYHGNITIQNENNEPMFCADVSWTILG